MKRLVRILFLAGVLMALLCVTAMAAEETGIRNLSDKSNSTVTSTIDSGKEKITVQVKSPKSAAQYLVLALKGDSKTPSADNIVYIDQNGTGSFTVYPSQLANNTTYHIYIASDTDGSYNGLTEVATFEYYQLYTLGDVNDDTYINADDALMALQAWAKKISLTATQISAADVNNDTYINADDALKILQFWAKKITSFN